MAKKIRQLQVENLDTDLSALNNKKVQSIAFSGTTSKTLTITFTDNTTLTADFTDNNTTYPSLTAADLTTGIATTDSVVQAKILADYINTRLSALFVYKGNVATFATLPATGNKVGDTWNVSAAFTHGGTNYPAGTNVAWNGTDWDPLSGVIDTSAFLTAEVDPWGVKSIAVSGTTNKTITITLRNDQTITGSFTDDNTTYATGTLGLLTTGNETVGKLWTAKDIADFVKSYQITVKHELTTITAGMIASGNVNITPSTTITDKTRVMVFLNGVKQPVAAYSMVTSTLRLVQASLPTPIIVGDEVEIFYL